MITELMIILIVVGAIIIFVAWTSARKRKHDDEDRKDAEESTEKFKQDLEKTANEIIGRMETQAAHLEKLFNDSEHSRTQIEGRIAELKKLLKKIDSASAEVKDLLARLDYAVENFETMQRQANLAEQKVNSKSSRQPTKSPMPPPPMLITPQPSQSPTQNFAQVLESSLTENPPPKRSEQLAMADDSEQDGASISGDSAAVREMLLDGMTVEEIARETGLGRGAILLVQQMLRRKSKN